MKQFASLAEEATTVIEKLLPEEALTQIYQARTLLLIAGNHRVCNV